MENRKAIIIGCGIAGPAVAIFLKRAGYEPHIYEAQPGHDDYTGLFLNVARNGLRILRELGVEGRIREEGIELRAMNFHSGSGKWLGKIEDPSGEPQGFTVKRGFLHKVLREAAQQEGIPIEFGKRLANLHIAGDRVTALFDDGTSAEGDLLVGCDGIHSRTRRLILPGAPEPDYTGLISFGGFARGVDIPHEPAQHMVFGKKAFFGYLVKRDGEIYWFGNLDYPGRPSRKELQSIPQAEWRRVLDDLYRNEIHPVPDIIRATKSEIGVYPIYDLMSVPSCTRDRSCSSATRFTRPRPTRGRAHRWRWRTRWCLPAASGTTAARRLRSGSSNCCAGNGWRRSSNIREPSASANMRRIRCRSFSAI